MRSPNCELSCGMNACADPRHRPRPAMKCARRRGPRGTATSLGTTNTGHPAPSAAAVPVTESSIARHAAGGKSEQRGRPPVGVGRGLAARHLVATYGGRKVVAPNAVQCTVGQARCVLVTSAIGVPSAASASSSSLRTVTPRQSAVEQFRGVVVQPAVGLGHRPRVEFQTQVGVDGPDGVLRRTADHRRPDLGTQFAAEFRVQRGQRDVPQLFGVDQGAVHIPQHRLHDGDCVTVAGQSHRFVVGDSINLGS